MPYYQYAYLHSCLVSDSYHIIITIVLCTCQPITVQDICSLLKTVLGKIGDRYQAYCSTYTMHAMATCHGGVSHPLDRGLDIRAKDPEHADIENESTHSSDTTVDLAGPEAVGHLEDLVYGNQDRLTALMREINKLHQRVAAGEGQLSETLDCIACEL